MTDRLALLSLNGSWTLDYLGNEPYTSSEMPEFTGYPVKDAVPGYWEDMLDVFRSTPLHTKLSYNPLYTLQRYPQAGYVPDMALPNVLGCFGYRRSFELEELPEGELFLHFGGVQNSVKVWINGTYVGGHEGYSSSFDIELEPSVLGVGRNTITLAVSNNRLEGYKSRPVSGCTSRAANECTGGIFGDIELRCAVSGVRSLRVSTSQTLDSFSVIPYGRLRKSAKIHIKDGTRVILSKDISADEPVAEFSLEGLEFWSIKCPKRYTAVLESEDGVIERRFGLRRLQRDGMRLTFNGDPFIFRGICEHGYYPVTVHPPRDIKYFRAVIKRLIELGFNAIRFHTTVPMAEYMEAADELGMLIEVETPNNTTYEEWCDIVRYTSEYTSVVMYSSGNEMVIDEEYIEHLRACAELVHNNTDSLFSPMSAMRGIEYHSWGDLKVEEPFPHNPKRLASLDEFCDCYNSYTRAKTSYRSDGGEADYVEKCNAIYSRPQLSHEICINGTYIDLSLARRYEGTRIGETELFSSVERHLKDKGLLDKAPVFYKNSVEWQRRIRKHCFELVRRCDSFAGYDFLGDIDHHWHTFGYCVGMMNEFYELKPTETVENVRRYNGDAVLLCDMPRNVNIFCGDRISLPILVSNYAEQIRSATLDLRISGGGKVYYRKSVKLANVKVGAISELYTIDFTMPKLDTPMGLTLYATLSGGNVDVNNEWELYAFPRVKAVKHRISLLVRDDMSKDELISAMKTGKSVVLFSAGPMVRMKNSFQISVAGRTEGHLATVIYDHPLMKDFPHSGFCSWQFREMMTESHTLAVDLPDADFAPIIEAASSYKCTQRGDARRISHRQRTPARLYT